MDNEIHDFNGFSNNYELQQHRFNYPYLKRMGSRRRHSTQGLSLVELENLALNCIKTRISLCEFPDPLLISRDMLATIGVLNFPLVNCFDLGKGDCYQLKHNQTINSHIELLGQLTQLVESYIICHQVATIYELEKWICFCLEVEEFSQLGVGNIHLLPSVIYHFRYLSTEVPYNVTLKNVLLGLNDFLNFLESRKESIQNKPNLCVEFVEFFIHHHNYSHPDRLGLIINNIDKLIKNWKAASSAQLNLVDSVMEELKQKFVLSVKKQLHQHFDKLCPFTSADASSPFSDLLKNIPLFTLIENTIQYMNCFNNSTNLNYLPTDIKRYEKYVQHLIVQQTSKIKHNIDREFLSDVIVMGSLISILEPTQQQQQQLNESTNDCDSTIDIIVGALNKLKTKVIIQDNKKQLINQHSDACPIPDFVESFFMRFKFTLQNISKSTVISLDSLFGSMTDALIGALSNSFSNTNKDVTLSDKLSEHLNDLSSLSPLLIVNNLPQISNVGDNLSKFISNIVNSLNRQINYYLKNNTKESAFQYVSTEFNIDSTYLRLMFEKNGVHDNIFNRSVIIVKFSHFFENYRNEHRCIIKERVNKLQRYLYAHCESSCVFDISERVLSLTERTVALAYQYCCDNVSMNQQVLLVETTQSQYIMLKSVTAKELGMFVEESFKKRDPYQCAYWLGSFVVSCGEFWHQVPTCLIIQVLTNAINTISMDYNLKKDFLIDVLANLPSKINTFLFLSVFQDILVSMFDDECGYEDILKYAFSRVKSSYGREYSVKFAGMAIECLVDDLDFFCDFTESSSFVPFVPVSNKIEFPSKIVETNTNINVIRKSPKILTKLNNFNLIDEIRKNKFGIIDSIDEIDPILKTQLDRQGRGLMKLSSELYSNKTHFLYELIQNFDDSFSKNFIVTSDKVVKPTCAFVLTKFDLYAISNETGFDQSDVEAVCDVGSSTKCTDKTTIGCKGIGFKSVFAISNKPEIHSNGFHFKFDSELYGPIGYILPEKCDLLSEDIIYFLRNVLSFQTCIRLPLKPDLRSLKLNVDECVPILLFLQHIKCIKLYQHETLTSYNKIQTDNYFSLITISKANNITNETTSQSYFTIRSDNNENCVAFSITLRMPELTKENDMLEQILNYQTQHEFLYCFLPVRSYGFKFIIQANFELSSSREEVVLDSAHNMNIFSCIPKLLADVFRVFTRQQSFLQCPLSLFALLLKFIPEKGSFLQTELFFVRRMIFDVLKVCEFVPCVNSHPDDSTIFVCPYECVLVYEHDWFTKLGKFFNPQSDLYIGGTIVDICRHNKLYLLHPKLTHIDHSSNSTQYIRDIMQELGCHYFKFKMVLCYLNQILESTNNFVCAKIFALLIDLIDLNMISPLICSPIQPEESELSMLSNQLKSLRCIPLQHKQVMSLKSLSNVIVYYTIHDKQSSLSSQHSIQNLCEIFLDCSSKNNDQNTQTFYLLNDSVVEFLLVNKFNKHKIENLLSNVLNFKLLDLYSLIKDHILPLLLSNGYNYLRLYNETLECLLKAWKSGDTLPTFIRDYIPLMCVDNNNNEHFITLNSSRMYTGGLFKKLGLKDHIYINQSFYCINFTDIDRLGLFFEYLGVQNKYNVDSVNEMIFIITNGNHNDRLKLLLYLDENWSYISPWFDNGISKNQSEECNLKCFETLLKTESWILNRVDEVFRPCKLISSIKNSTLFDHTSSSFDKFLTKYKLTNKSFQSFIGVETKLTGDFCLKLLEDLSLKSRNTLPPLSVYTLIYMTLAKSINKDKLHTRINSNKKLIYLPNSNDETHNNGRMYSSDQVCYNDKLFCSTNSLKCFYPHSDLKALFVDHFNVDLSPKNYLNLLVNYFNVFDVNDDNIQVEIITEKIIKFFVHFTKTECKKNFNNFVNFQILYDNILVISSSSQLQLDHILKTYSHWFSKVLNIDLSQTQPNIYRIIVNDLYLENYLPYFQGKVDCVHMSTLTGSNENFIDIKLPLKKFEKLYAKLYLLKLYGFELLSKVIQIDCGCTKKLNYCVNMIEDEATLEKHYRNIIHFVYTTISSTLLQYSPTLIIPQYEDFGVKIVHCDDRNPFLRVHLNTDCIELNGRMCFLESDNFNCWYINSLKTNQELIPKITSAQLDEFMVEFGKLFASLVTNNKWRSVIVDVVSDLTKSSHIVTNQFSNFEKHPGLSVALPKHNSEFSPKSLNLPSNLISLDSSNKFTDHVGRSGEEFFYDYISNQTYFNKNKIVDVEWINASEESFLPYDFIVTVEYLNTTASYFVEVKSTSVLNKNHFFLSLNELTFALDNTVNYFICRVFVDSTRNSENSRICNILGNIVDKIGCKDFKLILAFS